MFDTYMMYAVRFEREERNERCVMDSNDVMITMFIIIRNTWTSSHSFAMSFDVSENSISHGAAGSWLMGSGAD